MKDNKKSFGKLVAAALVGLSANAVASTEVSAKFTAYEDLPAEKRIELEPRLELLDQYVKIDWDQSVVGLNEKGELVVRDRQAIQLQDVTQPTCWGH